MSADPPGDRAIRSSGPGLGEAIKVDLVRLHGTWMGLVFPRQQTASHSVLGKWRPRSTAGKIKYRLWELLGVPIIAVAYPLAILGFATRFYTRRIDRTAASIGVIGVVLLSIIVWSALTAAAYLRDFTFEGIVAVAAAGGVATVSAALAMLFARIGGRGTTVVLAYPFAMNAIFLPPVVAALYSPVLANIVFPSSETVAVWVLDNVLYWYGLNDTIRYYFDLEGLAYVGMWCAIAIPIGWTFGLLVTLANLVRPSGRGE